MWPWAVAAVVMVMVAVVEEMVVLVVLMMMVVAAMEVAMEVMKAVMKAVSVADATCEYDGPGHPVRERTSADAEAGEPMLTSRNRTTDALK